MLFFSDERIIPYITRDELNKVESDFESLSFEEKKQALIALVDKNKLYVNYTDMNDQTFNVTEEDKRFTKSFRNILMRRFILIISGWQADTLQEKKTTCVTYLTGIRRDSRTRKDSLRRWSRRWHHVIPNMKPGS